VDPEIIKIQGGGIQPESAPENMISAAGFFQCQSGTAGGRMIFIKQFAGQKFRLHGCGHMDMKGAVLSGHQSSEGGFERSLPAVVEDSHGSLLLRCNRGLPEPIIHHFPEKEKVEDEDK
jgi:hypothetical protein